MSQPVKHGLFRAAASYVRPAVDQAAKNLQKFVPKGSQPPKKIQVKIVSDKELQKMCDENFNRRLKEAEKRWEKDIKK